MKALKRTLASALFLALACGGSLHAQSGGNESYRNQFDPNNAGTEFFCSFPSNWDLPGSTAYYIRLYITSATATEVQVWAGPNLKKTVTTVPYQIVPVDLTPAEAQAVVRADQPPVPNDRVFQNKAIRIVSEEPVVVYAVNRTTFTSDGMLLLPTSALGREYIAGSYGAVIGVTQELPSQYVIAAPYDGTTVEIYHPHRTPNHAAGETFTINLNRGDVWSAMTVGYGGDMSGTIIKANKPIAVTAGQACTYIPNLLNFCCCDHITEMILPTESWGKVYHGVPFATRLKGDFYRVFAKEPNTKVSINGQEYATLSSVGGEEGIGWFEYRALGRFTTEITADKPIQVFQYNSSQAYDGVPSDPFYLTLTPMEQQGTEFTFSTPGNDFPQNFLNVATDSSNFYEIEIARADESTWTKLSDLPDVSPLQIYPTEQGGMRYVGTMIEIDGGVYKLRAPRPFAGYSYGFSNYDSYGHPIGAYTTDLEGENTPPGIAMDPQSCGGVTTGMISSRSQGSHGDLALSRVYLEQNENFRLELPGFEPAFSTSARYMLVPVDKSKAATAVVYGVDMAGNVTSATAHYEAGSASSVALEGGSVEFPKTSVGAQSTISTVITNKGTEPVTITSITFANGGSRFRLIGQSLPVTIAANGSLTVEVEFSPDAAGRFDDLLLLMADCGVAFSAPVQGTAESQSLSVPGMLPSMISGSAVVAPNPVRGDQAAVGFTMERKGTVSIVLVDASGKELRSVADGVSLERGEQSLKLDLAGLPSGTYFVRIAFAGGSMVAPVVVAR